MGYFLPGGGGGFEPLAQKMPASCPSFQETVEEKQGSYDKLRLLYEINIYSYV